MDEKDTIKFSDQNMMKLSPSESEKWRKDLEKYVPSHPDNDL